MARVQIESLGFVALSIFGSMQAGADSGASCPPAFVCPPLEDATRAACQTVHPTAQDIRAILKKNLASATHELKRKVYFYHYGQNPLKQSGPVDPNDSALAERFFYDKTSGRSFFDPVKNYRLYTANNPLVSADYLEDPGLLLRIGVPAGIKYLDVSETAFSDIEALQVACYLEAQPKKDTPLFHDIRDCPEPIQVDKTVYADRFVERSDEARDMIRGVYGELKIAMYMNGFRGKIFPECPGNNMEMQFIDPTISGQLEMTVYSKNLESHPSPQKLAAYRDLFRYFEVVKQGEVKGIGNAVEPKFWQIYRAWAPAVYALPPGTDWIAFQKKQSGKMASQRAEVTSEMFGCSNDPKNHEEEYFGK